MPCNFGPIFTHNTFLHSLKTFFICFFSPQVVDFVAPYFDQSGISIIIRKPVRPRSLFKFMEVLRVEVSLVYVLVVLLMPCIPRVPAPILRPHPGGRSPRSRRRTGGGRRGSPPYTCTKGTCAKNMHGKSTSVFVLFVFTPLSCCTCLCTLAPPSPRRPSPPSFPPRSRPPPLSRRTEAFGTQGRQTLRPSTAPLLLSSAIGRKRSRGGRGSRGFVVGRR